MFPFHRHDDQIHLSCIVSRTKLQPSTNYSQGVLRGEDPILEPENIVTCPIKRLEAVGWC